MHRPTNSFKDWVAVGGDLGSLQVVEVISNSITCRQLSLIPDGIHSVPYWLDFLREKKILGLFCGTSKSSSGFNFEKNIRIAAHKLKLPTICIEDFSGNYTEVRGASTSILVVEDKFSIKSYENKLVEMPYIVICPSIRYDCLRGVGFNRSMTGKDSVSSRKALWVGQPEFESNFLTLKHIVSSLKRLSVTLLFRAHPRDSYYQRGVYGKFFNSIGLSWVDLNNQPLNHSIFLDLSLVITQFSSLAIEAGFYGIPTLNILLENAGKKLLLNNTGTSELMTVHYDAAFLMNDQSPIHYLDVCFNDIARRKEIILNFQNLYKTNEKQLRKLLVKIQDIITININRKS